MIQTSIGKKLPSFTLHDLKSTPVESVQVSHKQQALALSSSVTPPIQMAFCRHSLLLFLLLLPNIISSQTNTKITQGTTFSPSNSNGTLWLSPSGDFAFGFRPLETNSSLFLLAVWFYKISDQTVVWTANRGNPVGSKSKVGLGLDGWFSLKDSAGQEIWNAGVTATYGSMLDTGNFILSRAGSVIIWETFQNPTDTILPGQVLKQPTSLYSKLMDDDYTRGRFEFALQGDGNLVMYMVSFPTTNRYDPYYDTATSGNGIELVFNESTGNVDLSLPNSSRPVLSSPSVTGDDYLRATLDPDGVFTFVL